MLKSEVKSVHIEDLQDINSPFPPKPEDIYNLPPPKHEDIYNLPPPKHEDIHSPPTTKLHHKCVENKI